MSRRSCLALAALAAALALPALASADSPAGLAPADSPQAGAAPAGSATSASAPVASASAGPIHARVKIRIERLHRGRAPIYGTVAVIGSLTPFRPGQRVTVDYYLNASRLRAKVVRVHRGEGNHGVFRSKIVVREAGKYAASARHEANQVMGGDRTVRKSWKVSFPSLRRGHCGRVVRGFRRALNDLGYVPGGGHCFNGKMGRAVLALRKVNGMSRNEHAGRRLVRMVFAGRGGYRVRYPGYGEHLEASLSKQVLVFANGERVAAIYPISSGKPSTPTVQGHFNFYTSQPGYNSEGMYYSRYFIGGYAVHGYHSVPNYPASHGCLRTYIADQPEIYRRIFIGEDIFVF
ncbi:MAG: L,D-transpeptidase [Solirubrobacterales bacterium]